MAARPKRRPRRVAGAGATAFALCCALGGCSGTAGAQSPGVYRSHAVGGPTVALPAGTVKQEVIASSRQRPPASPEVAVPELPDLPVPPPGMAAKVEPQLPGLVPAGVRSEERPAAPAAGAVFLEQRGPGVVKAGEPYRYEIIVRNPGPMPASGVKVEDELPAGAKLLRSEPRAETQGGMLKWDLGEVAAGKEIRLQVEVEPAAGGEFRSRAAATFRVASELQAKAAVAPLAVSLTGPETARAGETVAFRIGVTNNGPSQLNHLLLQVRLPAGLKHPQGDVIEADLGTLPAGQSREVTLRATVVQSGRLVNQVTALAEGGLEARASAVVQATPAAGGGLLLCEAGPRRLALNRPADYRLNVLNAGQSSATAVRIEDVLPEGLEFVSAQDGGSYDPASRTVRWEVGSLLAGESRAVGLRVRARSEGEWQHHAVARDGAGQETASALVVQVGGAPVLAIDVAEVDDPVRRGAETTYDVLVRNTSRGPAESVRVMVECPEGLTPLAGTGPVPGQVEGRRIAFAALGKLDSGGEAFYRLRVRAEQAGVWRLRVLVSTDQAAEPVCEEEVTRVEEATGQAPAGK